jgi:hypothetical protein
MIRRLTPQCKHGSIWVETVTVVATAGATGLVRLSSAAHFTIASTIPRAINARRASAHTNDDVLCYRYLYPAMFIELDHGAILTTMRAWGARHWY